MSIYKPTWLYIKQHNQTGLKYFGKTVKSDPTKYPGSGIYWRNHIKLHGNDVTTVWCKLFTDKNELTKYAIDFSVTNKIVESKEWANLIDETGLDGNLTGLVLGPKSDSIKRKISEANKGQRRSKETCDQMSKSHLGLPVWNKGIKTGPRPVSSCPHCGKSGSSAHMVRWHFDNCRAR